MGLHPLLKWMGILALVILIGPLVMYGFERATGEIPGETENPVPISGG